jgi:ABC-type bacteriocin/lantibiotic exporter with double-glycine peptidase domain
MPLFWHQKQGENNCGPTCMAIIANTTQRDACFKTFDQVRPAKFCFSWEADIRRGAEALKLKAGKRGKAKSFSDIRTLAIVSVDDDRHWIVYSPKEKEPLIYDPLEEVPMTVSDYIEKCKRKKIKSGNLQIDYYIAIEHPRKRRSARRPRTIR